MVSPCASQAVDAVLPIVKSKAKFASSPKEVIVATVSIDVDKKTDDRLAYLFRIIDQASNEGCQLIVFPEACIDGVDDREEVSFFDAVTTGLPSDDINEVKERIKIVLNDKIVKSFAEKAKEKNVHIVFNIYEPCEDLSRNFYNTTVLVGPNGYIGKYRKVHLYGIDSHLSIKGTDYPVFETSIGKIGLLVCYDIFFPEAARCLALKGANIIVLTSALPLRKKGKPSEDDLFLHVLTLSERAAALQNRLFVVSANVANKGAIGHSNIVDPNGNFLVSTGFEEGIAIASIGDPIHETTKAVVGLCGLLNFFKYRQPDTYGELLTKNIDEKCRM